MKDEEKTKSQLIEELKLLRHCLAEIKDAEAEEDWVEQTASTSKHFVKKDAGLLFDPGSFSNGSEDIGNPGQAFGFEGDIREGGGRHVFWIAAGDYSRILYASSSYEPIWQRSRQALLEHPLDFLEAVHPDDRQEVLDNLERQKLGEISEKTYRIVHPDGSIRLIRDCAFPILEPSGSVSRVIGVAEDVTRLKEAEDALRRSEEEHLNILENAMEGFYRVAPDGSRFLTANSAAARVLGYESPEELIDSITDISSQVYANPEDRREAVRLMAEQGFIKDFEVRCRHKEGRTVWCSFNARIIRDVDGKVLYHEGTSQDITGRKEAEQALIESKNFLETIINAIADPVFVKDRDHRWILLNDSLCRFMGYSLDELFGKSDYDFFPVKEADVFWDKDEEVFTTGIENENEEQFTDAKGATHTIITKKSRYVDGSGKMTLVGVIRDITERKRSEDALKKRDIQFKKLAANVPGMIYQFMRSPDGYYRVPFTTEAIKDIFGCSPEDVRVDFSPISRVVLTEDLNKLIRSIESSARHLTTWQCEYRVQVPGRPVRWLYGQSTPEKLSDGSIVWHGFNTDITERKRAEDERLRLEAQLRQSQKMEAIGTLAGGIAHDFNNILGIIMGNAELLALLSPEQSKERKYVDAVLKAGCRARDLVKQILVFSRMEGRLERQPVDLASTINETLKFLRASLPSTIEIRRNIPLRKIAASANVTQIHQLLANLCTNAAHAMEETGGILEVNLSEVNFDSQSALLQPNLTPGTYARLTVSDTGQGMDSWTLERIFDPYFTTKPVGKGTGLGLSMVRGIVNLHEGAITVRSEPGKGSTFEVYLPEIAQETTTSAGLTPPLPRGTERILFIDDEAALVDIGRKSLSLLGYEVEGKTSSVEALELFRADPGRFDLVIMDYTMPHMTGADLAREMMNVRPDIRIILCTGFNERITEEKARQMGIGAFVMKPYTMRDIAAPVRRVLDVT